MAENVESIYDMVTRKVSKHRTQMHSTTEGNYDHGKAQMFFSASDEFISYTFSLLLLEITLLILRVWVTNGAQTVNGYNSTYKSLSKTCARRIIPDELFYRIFLSIADATRLHLSTAFMRADFFNVRVHARKLLARTHAYTSARLARAHACTPASYETLV